jgi:hypothetical protein
MGDDSQMPWDAAPEWQRNSARAGAELHLLGDTTPADSHEAWMRLKLKEGWRWGPVKDPEKKEHPCLVPFSELPREQQAKDHLFRAVVMSMRTGLARIVIAVMRSLWDHAPDVRLRFGDGETGWGKDIASGNGVVAIANVPLEPTLRLMDVVTTLPSPDEPRLRIDKVIWRVYSRRSRLRYASPSDDERAEALWQSISKALYDAGLGAESFTSGLVGVCHHDDTDVLALLNGAGIDTSGFEVRQWEGDLQ